jgi:hypothetical protein
MPTYREVERKVRVDDAFDISPVLDQLGDYRARRGPTFSMHADYYDTDELTLFRWRMTLRRREGGLDQGWHLKIPVAGGTAGDRDEVRLELSEHVPARLGDIVSPLIGEKPLKAQVIVETLRTPASIVDSTGRMLAEVVDDRVAGALQLRRLERYPEAEAAWRRWLETSEYAPRPNSENGGWASMPGGENNHDTIGLLALDQAGRMAGACTTSGMAFKMRGRVGDSPIVGAGLFVDDAVGGATATGVGEDVVHALCGFRRYADVC